MTHLLPARVVHRILERPQLLLRFLQPQCQRLLAARPLPQLGVLGQQFVGHGRVLLLHLLELGRRCRGLRLRLLELGLELGLRLLELGLCLCVCLGLLL